MTLFPKKGPAESTETEAAGKKDEVKQRCWFWRREIPKKKTMTVTADDVGQDENKSKIMQQSGKKCIKVHKGKREFYWKSNQR